MAALPRGDPLSLDLFPSSVPPGPAPRNPVQSACARIANENEVNESRPRSRRAAAYLETFFKIAQSASAPVFSQPFRSKCSIALCVVTEPSSLHSTSSK